MKIKYVLCASAAALGLAIAGGAMAQTTTTGSDHGSSTDATTTNLANSLNGNSLLSNNQLTKNTNVTKYDDSFNSKTVTETKNSTKYEDSFNSKTVTETKTNNINKYSVHDDQSLSANVSGNSFDDTNNDGNGSSNGVSTGSISWNTGALQGFGGIQTQSVNTGLGSINQAATSVAANANVTFGH